MTLESSRLDDGARVDRVAPALTDSPSRLFGNTIVLHGLVCLIDSAYLFGLSFCSVSVLHSSEESKTEEKESMEYTSAKGRNDRTRRPGRTVTQKASHCNPLQETKNKMNRIAAASEIRTRDLYLFVALPLADIPAMSYPSIGMMAA